MKLLMVGNIVKYQGTDWEIKSFTAGNHSTFAMLENEGTMICVPVEELEFDT